MLSFKYSVLSVLVTLIVTGALGAPLTNNCPTASANVANERITRLECLMNLVYDKVFDDTTGYDKLFVNVTDNTSKLLLKADKTYVDNQLSLVNASISLKANNATLSDFASLSYVNDQLNTKASTVSVTSLTN